MTASYQALDDAICQYLVDRPGMHPIYSGPLLKLARDELADKAGPDDDKAWRLIDRRLQAMRRAGRIAHVRETGLKPRWEVCNGN